MKIETLRLYSSSAWSRLAEALNIDPQRRVCTFRLKVVLTTLTVCGILFGAGGIAVLGRGGNTFDRSPKGLIDGELQEMMMAANNSNNNNGSAKVEKAPAVVVVVSTLMPTTTSTDLTDSITDDDGDDVTDDGFTEDEVASTTASTPLITTTAKKLKEGAHFGPLSIDKRDQRKAVTTKDLLNALNEDSARRGRRGNGHVTPCPPGKQLVKKVVTEEVVSAGLNGGPLLSYSTRLICKVPKGLPWYLKSSTTPRPKATPAKNLKIKTAYARNARNRPAPKILKNPRVTPTRRPNRLSTPFRGRPKTRNIGPHKGGPTTRRPNGVHHQGLHGSRKGTTKRGYPRRRTPPNHKRVTTRRPWKARSTFPPRVFRPSSTPSVVPPNKGPWDWKKWRAKMIARWCARLCATNPALGGHICHCDDPPMEC